MAFHHHIITSPNYQIRIEIMNKLTAYIKDSYTELVEKVTWPNWDELQQSTMIVLGATAVITFIVWIMDFVANGSLKFIYSLFATKG
jgi:preprotein translocase subunit SecE